MERAGWRSTAAWPTTPAALYGARYTVAAAGRLDEPPAEQVALAGRHCESGDVLARDVELPQVVPGDLVAFAATGAYGQSMASTYNATPRLAAVLVDAGEARLLTRRETVAELFARDLLADDDDGHAARAVGADDADLLDVRRRARPRHERHTARHLAGVDLRDRLRRVGSSRSAASNAMCRSGRSPVPRERPAP